MAPQYTLTKMCELLDFKSGPENGKRRIHYLKDGQACFAGLRSGFV